MNLVARAFSSRPSKPIARYVDMVRCMSTSLSSIHNSSKWWRVRAHCGTGRIATFPGSRSGEWHRIRPRPFSWRISARKAWRWVSTNRVFLPFDLGITTVVGGGDGVGAFERDVGQLQAVFSANDRIHFR